MKRKYKILILLSVLLLTISFTAIPAFALTESEVQNQVNAVGKEAVTGNIFVWFLCAIAFLKVSQKIDSFMSSLGINVGHTGGSMLAEAMIAMRGVGAAKSFSGGRGGGGGSSGSSGGGNTFLKGGLSGVVSRKVTNNAINNANGSKSGGLGEMGTTIIVLLFPPSLNLLSSLLTLFFVYCVFWVTISLTGASIYGVRRFRECIIEDALNGNL